MFNFMYFLFTMLLIMYMSFFMVIKHYVSAMLILEAMVLILLIFSLNLVGCLMDGYSIYLWVLTLSVCEAAMGLSLLISLVKVKSNELIISSF
uniref:NADH dehydrogenase subunit 4L n=1 Tax=Thaumatoptyx cf. gonyptyx RM-2016 TaxID=1885853 RepID=A0A224ACE7_9EUPU|nr:NADH dehydrogenase subunit 4L [Thaumatoptyx cf. gonyptyx RM-2016]